MVVFCLADDVHVEFSTFKDGVEDSLTNGGLTALDFLASENTSTYSVFVCICSANSRNLRIL